MTILWTLAGAALGFCLVGLQASRYDLAQAKPVYILTTLVGAAAGFIVGRRYSGRRE